MRNKNKSVDDTIHVAYALNDNYTMYTCISMTSLLHNTKRNVQFHVLESRLSEENKQILRDIGLNYPHGTWTFYHVDIDESFVIDIDNNSYLTPETYFRLLLPSLLADIDRVVWIDSDTIVEGDISELYNLDLCKFPLGAVIHDVVLTTWESVLELKKGTYFNAGMLLLDIRELRNFDLLGRAKQVIPVLFEKFRKAGTSFLADQEVLNHLFQSNYKALPPKFNVFMAFTTDVEVYSLDEYVEAQRSPVVLHFGGKPFMGLIKLDKLNDTRAYTMIEKLYFYISKTYFAELFKESAIIEHEKKRRILYDFLEPYQRINLFNFSIIDKAAKKLSQSEYRHNEIAVWGVNWYSRMLVLILCSHGLNVEVIVDGISSNRGQFIWGLEVSSPDVLWQSESRYFVVLAMRTDSTANKVHDILIQHGYTPSESYHIYEAAYVE